MKSGTFWHLCETPEISLSSKQHQLQGQESKGSKGPLPAFATAKPQLLQVKPAAISADKRIFSVDEQGEFHY